MNYWLMKSEPDAYSYEQLERDKKGVWDGVRNYQARNNMKEMKEGDLFLFYHSNIGKEVVGIGKIIKEHYPDPTTEDKHWVVVEVAPFKKLKQPVTLERIKAEPRLSQMPLVRHTRLSVMPIKKEEFDLVVELGS